MSDPGMKILCLHGNGTNNSILELQTAPLRHELQDDEHKFEFVQAVLEAPMAEGVEALCSPSDSCYAYYDPINLNTLHDALSQLDEYVSAEGPFDAILGFSAGAVLATLYMAQYQQQRGSVPFKCGIFFASAVSKAEMAQMGLDRLPDKIRVPTMHIWGLKDRVAPSGGEDLRKAFDETLQEIVVHDGGHEFPRQEFLDRTTHGIRRTTRKAAHKATW